MDVHIGREQITSWRDFVVRYLLIVAGILSAWAVNQWNEHRHDRQIAEQTRQALDAELASDLKELNEAREFNVKEARRLEGLRNELVDMLKAHKSPSDIEEQVVRKWQGQLIESVPALRRDGWDAAVAGQAVTRLAPDELRRYSAAYAALGTIAAGSLGATTGTSTDLQRRYAAWSLSHDLGHADYADLAQILNQWSTMLSFNAGLTAGMQVHVAEALQMHAHAAGPNAATPQDAAGSAPR